MLSVKTALLIDDSDFLNFLHVIFSSTGTYEVKPDRKLTDYVLHLSLGIKKEKKLIPVGCQKVISIIIMKDFVKRHFLTTKLGSKHNAISTPVQTTTKTCLTKYSETHAHNYNSISNNKQQMMLTFKKKKKMLRRKRTEKKWGESLIVIQTQLNV